MVRHDDEPGSAAAAATPFDSVVGRVETQLARGRPSGAIDPPAPVEAPLRQRGGRVYATGIAIGIGIVGAVLQCVIEPFLAAMDQTWAMFEAPIADGARLLTSPAWRYGAPVALIGLLVVAHVLAGRGRRWPARVVAVIAIVTPILTYYVAASPFWAISGNIK